MNDSTDDLQLKNMLICHGNYFSIRPNKNELYQQLLELKERNNKVFTLRTDLEHCGIVSFPEIMERQRIIIEFNDCIV